jgi:hypothetical protein
MHDTPNKMHNINEILTCQNFLKYGTRGNAQNLARYAYLTDKSFAYEYTCNIYMLLHSFLLDFAPHMADPTPSITVIENKKPTVYWSATMQIDKDSHPVNWIVDKSTKPDIVFGSTQLEQFETLWCITRATFPQEFILQ